MKFAVVGAGISGLSAAWLLGSKHDVTLFEAEDRLGGHANTITVAAPEGAIPIDTGFIVYNTQCYPNLIALFDAIGVPTAASDMSFAVSLDGGGYEYAGSGFAGLIGQARNLASPAHLRMMAEIFRFFREANAIDAGSMATNVTLGDWLAARGYSQRFIHAHIVPMGAAIWSTPADEMLAFPFAAFARFFANHGLLQTFNRPAWRTVQGGSKEYVGRLKAQFSGQSRAGDPVVSALPDGNRVRLRTHSGYEEIFDGALLACHADEALAITGSSAALFGTVLSAFRYAENSAVLHTDAGQMPRRRRLWSSWNYIGQKGETRGQTVGSLSVSYWMNRLQPLGTKTDYFVTLNPATPIAERHIVRRQMYRHPMFDAAALSAQPKLLPLQGRNSLWFAGSYFGYGFHEDGVQAGLAAAEDMSLRLGGDGGRVTRPWTWDTRLSRIGAAGAVAPGHVKVTVQ